MKTSESLHIAAAGMGVNTVAYLIICTKKGIVFDKILFADPGKENPKTYKYIPLLNKWLVENGQPEVTIVRTLNKNGEFVGLYNDCLNNNSLPSIVYGYKTCSLKFKKAAQDKYLNNFEPTQYAWSNGIKVFKYIGYDADESHRTGKDYSDEKYSLVYPLVEEDMGRFECIKVILDSGLPLPPKSSCTFCPSMKPWEIVELYLNNRKEFYDAIRMERNANLTHIKGLGRDFSWWDLIVAFRYLELCKKYNSFFEAPKKIKKLMRKVNRSKPDDYEMLSKKRKSTKDFICDLFKQSIELPCECTEN